MRNALGFHDNEIGTYRIFRESVQSQTMIDLANVGYIIYDDRIQKNQGDLGKAKLYYDFEQSGNVIDRLNDVNFDYRNVLLVGATGTVGAKNILPVRYDNGKMKFEIESTANAMLFVSENKDMRFLSKRVPPVYQTTRSHIANDSSPHVFIDCLMSAN